jgi:thiol-disulfide isomerase/thioredoxin
MDYAARTGNRRRNGYQSPSACAWERGDALFQLTKSRFMVRFVSISLPVLLGCGLMEAAGPPLISPRDYSIHGELSYSYFKGTSQTYAEKRQCEVLRDGDRLRITTSIYGSNYPANVFLCDATDAFTCVQYRAEEPSDAASELATHRAWNAASVWVSSYRMPSHAIGKLTPLWLMAQGQAERAKVTPDGTWITVFGNWVSFDFHNQPKTVPEAAAESFWPDGFAHFVESFDFPDPENARQTILQEEAFNIIGWTNCAGARFPAGFLASVIRKRKSASTEPKLISEARFAFVTTRVEPGSVVSWELRAPRFSDVQDMRPFERGDLANGVTYRSTDGMIYLDPLSESKEHGLRLIPVIVRSEKPGGPRVGALAPDFNISALDGKSLKFANLGGKYVLLNFWATWCGPCIGEIPDLKETYDAFGKDERFVMVGLSLDSNREQLVGFIKSKDIRWPQALLAEGFEHTIAKNYRVDAIPFIFLIGPDGKFIFCRIGGHGIKQAIASVLAPK